MGKKCVLWCEKYGNWKPMMAKALPWLMFYTIHMVLKQIVTQDIIQSLETVKTHLTFGINGKDSVSLVKKFAGISNVDSCFLLISSQHPCLDPSLSESSNGIWHSILQPVFNPSCTWPKWRRRKLNTDCLTTLNILLFICIKRYSEIWKCSFVLKYPYESDIWIDWELLQK